MHRPFMGTRRDFLVAACAALFPQVRPTKNGLSPIPASTPIRFHEIAHQAGIDFVLENNPTPRKHMIETMSGGVAAFDYNNDGLTDIFFTNGASIPSLEKDSPDPRSVQSVGKIVAIPEVGGLHHRYERRAA